MAHKDGNDFQPKKPRFTDKPLTPAEEKAQQHRRAVMHWRHRMRKIRNHNRLWKQY